MSVILRILPDLSMQKFLAPGRRRHQDYFVIFLQLRIQPIQLADMRAVDEDIEMPAEIAIRIDQVEFNRRVLPDHLFKHLIDR